MSGLQLTETTIKTESAGEIGTSAEEGNQQRLEPDFPHAKLATLDEKISGSGRVMAVLLDQLLESLLQDCIDFCKKGIHIQDEDCQRFFREGLTIFFTKILTDDAVNSWKLNIHNCINANCELLVELCVLKLDEDWFSLLDLLAMVFNPNNKFHTFNAARASETVSSGSNIPDEKLYARPPSDSRNPRGWLVDLINRFGSLHGFVILLTRFQSGRNLTVPVIFSLLRPFGLCYKFLTVHTIEKYLMPIIEMVPVILDNLTDEELKKVANNESKNDALFAIIKYTKCLVSRVRHQKNMIKNLERLRLKMILRILLISSFNGKMNALNEVNKVIVSVSYYTHLNPSLGEEAHWGISLTAKGMAKWIKDNSVLGIVLRDSLHQPHYVEELEKILRFIIKERALTLQDLDAVWAAQAGKHEAIVKNVHDLLAKLAWDFSPKQLDRLFQCFQWSWRTTNKEQQKKLLELICRLAEDDKDGAMANKFLMLFWNLAHSGEVSTEIMDQVLNAHVKILDYSCSQKRDALRKTWLDKCVEELKSGDIKWALPALKQIREICCLYEPNPRQKVIKRLHNKHTIVMLVTNSLTSYMDKVRQLVKENPEIDANTFMPDNRYNHIIQVQERLNFLRFLLKDRQLWPCAEQAKQIWQYFAKQAVFTTDREACFKWYSKLMGEEPDLDPSDQ